MRSDMKDEEKNLIENLFNRLKNAELNCSGRDHSADELIQELVKRQPASSYYMAQTILVQETHIKKMSLKIEELKKKIEILNKEESNKKPSFLSSFFKKILLMKPYLLIIIYGKIKKIFHQHLILMQHFLLLQ